LADWKSGKLKFELAVDFLQLVVYVWDDLQWVQRFIVSSNWVSLVIHQKFFKIPPDIIPVEGFVVVLLGIAELLSGRVTARL